MWFRAVRAGQDRGVETEVVDAVRVHQRAQPPRELALGVADPGLGRERLEGVVGSPGGAADLLDLALVLHRPQALDDARRRHELELARTKHLDLRVRQRVGLEGEPPLEPPGQIARQRPLCELDLDAGHPLGVLDVAEVGVEPRLPAGLDEERGVRALEPGQVADVDQVRDEQPLVEARTERVEAGGHDCVPAR